MTDDLFNHLINRANTGAVKWDYLKLIYGEEDLLPMWVADMDFSSPKSVQEALLNRVNHSVFGYTAPNAALYDSIVDWMKNRHQWTIEKAAIMFSPGVVSALSTTIRAFTEPGDKVMIQSPVYTPFADMIKSNDRVVVNSPLLMEGNRFYIDFDDFEEQLKSGVKLFLLCSPHNPGGRVWSKGELQKIGELCLQYGVLIVSDEIHADLFMPQITHYPLASLEEKIADITITCLAPSKTFNIAGIHASVMVVSNEVLRNKINHIQHQQAFHGLNIFALTAMEAAYKGGADWLESLIAYIDGNIEFALEFIARELPQLQCMRPEASYLLWIDCRAFGYSDEDLQKLLITKGRLALEPGPKYGEGGSGFVRMNIGCPREVLIDGLNRLKLAFS